MKHDPEQPKMCPVLAKFNPEDLQSIKHYGLKHNLGVRETVEKIVLEWLEDKTPYDIFDDAIWRREKDRRKDLAAASSSRAKARDMVRPGRCERCWKEDVKTQVHHLSGDCFDNRPENLMRLCQDCHTRAHVVLRECFRIRDLDW